MSQKDKVKIESGGRRQIAQPIAKTPPQHQTKHALVEPEIEQ